MRALRKDEEVTADADYLFAQRDHTIAGNTPVLLGRLAPIAKTRGFANSTTPRAVGCLVPSGLWSTWWSATTAPATPPLPLKR